MSNEMKPNPREFHVHVLLELLPTLLQGKGIQSHLESENLATSTKGIGTTDDDERGGAAGGVVDDEVDGEGKQLGKGLSGRNER
ncbi:unnamed protein product [Lactuca virosa]|uniref:Uncharacterized protein n=1 Tax=Lactuca virosa TaxID=75947 RepID=A0AAU9LTX4_9ASTR|nr:unnamed protein product [Lactuca virosa]